MRTQAPLVEVDTEMSVAETRRAIEAAGAGVALVTYFGRVVGVITLDELDSPAVADDEPIGEVVVREVVQVAPTADYRERLAAYHSAAWDSLRRRSPERARRLSAMRSGVHG